MYPEYVNKVQCADTALGGNLLSKSYDPTVGENIDRQIAELEERLADLRASKEQLAPLLGMKISSLRNAMNF